MRWLVQCYPLSLVKQCFALIGWILIIVLLRQHSYAIKNQLKAPEAQEMAKKQPSNSLNETSILIEEFCVNNVLPTCWQQERRLEELAGNWLINFIPS